MRRVSLSKLIHIFTSIVYLFTFLGPSVALATRTATMEEEPKVLRLRLAPQQSRQYDIDVSPGIGPRSLYVDIAGQRELITPFKLQGHKSYKELFVADKSVGFTGSLPGVGDFICEWGGNVSVFNEKRDKKEEAKAKEALNFLQGFTKSEQNIGEFGTDVFDDNGCYSYTMGPSPYYQTFHPFFFSFEGAWRTLANAMKGAFIPLMESLNLLNEEAWDMDDLAEATGRSILFLEKYQLANEESLEQEEIIKKHLNASVFLHMKSFNFFCCPSAQVNEAEKSWSTLLKYIGGNFKSYTEQLDTRVYSGNPRSFFTFSEDLLEHLGKSTLDKP